MLTWMHDKRVLVDNDVSKSMYGTTQSQHCNNDNEYNDDNVMRASGWFEFFGGLF